jgi:hypothetical protein
MSLTYLGWQQVTVDERLEPPEPAFSRQYVVSRRSHVDTLQTSHNLLYGNSGGGFFDPQGRLIGLLSGGLGPTGNNSLVALIHPAIELLRRQSIDCRHDGEAAGQPEPQMVVRFRGEHYRVVDRTLRTPNEAAVPISINNVKLNLSFITGSQGGVVITSS